MMFGMTSKISGAVAAVVLAAVVAGGAQAATITVFDHSTNRAGNTANVFGAGYSANTPAGAVWSTDPTVTPPPGSVAGVYKSPFDLTPLQDTQSYFSVGGTIGGNAAESPVTLTYASAQKAIKMLWGSIDNYNKIDFYLGASLVGTVTGAMAAAAIPVGLVTKSGYEEVALLSIGGFGQGGFDKIKFTSTQAALEFALPAAVPVPAAGLLLLTALGGVAALRRRKAA